MRGFFEGLSDRFADRLATKLSLPDVTVKVDQQASLQKCPICDGHGDVELGFYQTPQYPFVSFCSSATTVMVDYNPTRERCRACNGVGVVR